MKYKINDIVVIRPSDIGDIHEFCAAGVIIEHLGALPDVATSYSVPFDEHWYKVKILNECHQHAGRTGSVGVWPETYMPKKLIEQHSHRVMISESLYNMNMLR